MKIKLTQGKSAIVDAKDLPLLRTRKWNTIRAGRIFYAVSSQCGGGKRKRIFMHRVIMGINPGMDIDHINGNGLDNRRKNLRVCTHAQNCHNARPQAGSSSGYKGVAWYRWTNRWRAQIRVGGKLLHIGYFKDKEAAATAYNREAKIHFGEFAYLNKIKGK